MFKLIKAIWQLAAFIDNLPLQLSCNLSIQEGRPCYLLVMIKILFKNFSEQVVIPQLRPMMAATWMRNQMFNINNANVSLLITLLPSYSI